MKSSVTFSSIFVLLSLLQTSTCSLQYTWYSSPHRDQKVEQNYLGLLMPGAKNHPPAVLTDGPIVSDSLSIQRDVSIFAEFVRGVESVSRRLENASENTTVLGI